MGRPDDETAWHSAQHQYAHDQLAEEMSTQSDLAHLIGPSDHHSVSESQLVVRGVPSSHEMEGMLKSLSHVVSAAV